MKIDRNSAKYVGVMNSHSLDVPLGLLPEAIAKREKDSKFTLRSEAFFVGATIILFLAFLFSLKYLNEPDPAFFQALLLVISIAMLLMLTHSAWDNHREKKIYRDIENQIGDWQQFWKTYPLQCRREYCCGEQHEHEKENCMCYQVICGFYAHTAQTGKEEVEEFIELGRGGSRALAIRQAKTRIDNWRAEDKIEKLFAEQFETFVLRKLREQAANQKNIQVLVD